MSKNVDTKTAKFSRYSVLQLTHLAVLMMLCELYYSDNSDKKMVKRFRMAQLEGECSALSRFRFFLVQFLMRKKISLLGATEIQI